MGSNNEIPVHAWLVALNAEAGIVDMASLGRKIWDTLSNFGNGPNTVSGSNTELSEFFGAH